MILKNLAIKSISLILAVSILMPSFIVAQESQSQEISNQITEVQSSIFKNKNFQSQILNVHMVCIKRHYHQLQLYLLF